MTTINEKTRKIIHIDMDCFYAAIEIRDNPALAEKPVAVGGTQEKRGVICTCNYIARKYGVHSAMPTATALRRCPALILLPPNMAKYRAASQDIQRIFHTYASLVEPLALDEAYLDVTQTLQYQGSATLIAQAICKDIWASQNLTASAGVAPNKMLAKIASGWNKPNGMLVIRPEEVEAFVENLQIKKLYGVGTVTAKKLHSMGVYTCADIQTIPLATLVKLFGKMGQHLYDQCRGIDRRLVKPNRKRKSLSVEITFPQDLNNLESCKEVLAKIYQNLLHRIEMSAADLEIKNQYVKVKFHDFKQTTTEIITPTPKLHTYLELLEKIYHRHEKPIRLLGLGVNFKTTQESIQTSLFGPL